jgi:hypothetical protein
MADLSDLLTMELLLAYALACKKLAKNCEKTPKEIEAELRAESKILLEDSKISRTDLEAMMRSVMRDSET